MIFGLMVTSCSIISNAKVDDLERTKWDLLFYHKSKPIPDSIITIEFENGEVRGTSGCNTYFGEYKIQGSEISFGQIAGTEMACMNPERIMEQEQKYLTFLSEVVAYSIEGDRLILKKAHQDQLTFEKSTNN
jgi:heat shock protein HslJ